MPDESDARNREAEFGAPREPERDAAAPVPHRRQQDEQAWAGQPVQRNHTPLITNRLPGGWRKLPHIDAHCTYVLEYAGGELVVFPHPPRLADRTGSVRSYVVDKAPRRVHGTLKVGARDDMYAFEVVYDGRWRVADPARVVRDNVHDGDGTVADFLGNRLGMIARQFDRDDATGVATQIHDMISIPAEFEEKGLAVGDGLALIALAVTVTPDPRVAEWKVALDNDFNKGLLDERGVTRLRHLLEGDASAILLHLARNPSDTETVLKMITDARDKSERTRLEWLDRMREDGAIQEADYEYTRTVILGGGAVPQLALDGDSFRPGHGPQPRIIEAGGSAEAPPRPSGNPFPAYEPGSEPTRSAPTDPPPFDSDPFRAATEPREDADQGADASPFSRPSTPAERTPKPAVPRRDAPRAPRDVRAHRLKGGSVAIQWRAAGDVEYRVRRLDDGSWHEVATTTDTFIEDGGAPPGAVPVYSVSADAGGARSTETRSDA